MLTLVEVMEDLRFSRSTATRWIQRGYLPALRTPSGTWRFLPDDVAQLKQWMVDQGGSYREDGTAPLLAADAGRELVSAARG